VQLKLQLYFLVQYNGVFTTVKLHLSRSGKIATLSLSGLVGIEQYVGLFSDISAVNLVDQRIDTTTLDCVCSHVHGVCVKERVRAGATEQE